MRAFVDDVFVHGRLDRLAGYFDGDRYVQHNPHIGDNLSGLAAALEAMAAKGITMKYDRIHKVLGEGNFVLVVSEGSFAGLPPRFTISSGRERKDRRALGHDRSNPRPIGLEERQRQVRVLRGSVRLVTVLPP